jgi:cytoskeletal protein RodZ
MNLNILVTSIVAAFLASIVNAANLTQQIAERDAKLAAAGAETDAKLKELDGKYQQQITDITAKLNEAISNDIADKTQLASISQELNDIKPKFEADEQTIVDLKKQAAETQAIADAANTRAAKQAQALEALQTTDNASASTIAEALTKAGIPLPTATL